MALVSNSLFSLYHNKLLKQLPFQLCNLRVAHRTPTLGHYRYRKSGNLVSLVVVQGFIVAMLAPRKKLWSTPLEVIDQAIALLKPAEGELVYDIGAGDGNFIIRCAETATARCIGVEIDEARAAEAKANITEHGLEENRCQIVCGNALEYDYSEGICFFLYLVPRGLRIILPHLQGIGHRIRVVTYMSPLPGIEASAVVKVSTAAHPEAQWPLFYYELN
jgi:SAM-dependent methyltransferase